MKGSKFCIVSIIFVFLFFSIPKNTECQVTNSPVIMQGDKSIVVEKYVQIPDVDGDRPRLNTFAFAGNRKFVGEIEGGQIFEIIENPSTGQTTTQVFLNVKTAVQQNTGRDLDASRGLRSVAFHPEFSTNGKLYTSVMEKRPSNTNGHTYISDVSNPVAADGVLLEWTFDFNTNAVDYNSYREVFRVGMSVFKHPITQIAFNIYAQPGEEDYSLLYITYGDGSQEPILTGGGQNNDALGKILRVNPLQSGNNSYSIPSTNPFVGNSAYKDELYAIGFRNPHNLSFNKDSNGNAHLIVADIGQHNIEELNIVTAGENYGWAKREGTFVVKEEGGDLLVGIESLPANEADFGYAFPVAQYLHNGDPNSIFEGKNAIAGGYVYYDAVENIRHCIFGDFPIAGFLYYCDFDDMTTQTTKLSAGIPPSDLTQSQVYQYEILFDDDNNTNTPAVFKSNMQDIINDESSFEGGTRVDLRFGQDFNGNIYITSKRNGWVYKIQKIIQDKETSNPTTDTYCFNPINDAYLTNNSALTNNSELRIESNKRVSYLMFDLSSISGTVNSAELTLKVGGDTGNGTIEVFEGAHNNWTASNLSSGNAPAPTTLLGNLNTFYNSNGSYTWSLNNVSTGSNYTLVMKQQSGNDVSFKSSENADVSGRPELCMQIETTLSSCTPGNICDDGNDCTSSETYDVNCNCSNGIFQDADNDCVCDADDICAAGDDTIDVDNDSIPDACDDCLPTFIETNFPKITLSRQANFCIQSNGEISTGSNVTYQAGHEIDLLNNFEVVLGAAFGAYISPCQ